MLSFLDLFQAIALWISYGNHKSEVAGKHSEGKDEMSDKTEATEKTSEPPVAESFNTVISLMPVCVTGVFFGLGAYFSPRYFIEISTQLKNQPQEGLMFGYLALQLAAVLHASLLRRYTILLGTVIIVIVVMVIVVVFCHNLNTCLNFLIYQNTLYRFKGKSIYNINIDVSAFPSAPMCVFCKDNEDIGISFIFLYERQ